jgi:phosphoribosylglycinamide formyltransferase-1
MVLKLAVLISGKGSNLAAIQHAIETGQCAARIQLVVSDRSAASGLEFAAARGLSTAIVSFRDHVERASWDHALAAAVAQSGSDLVVLAGFMRLVGPALLARFPRRIINVHPALLPLFPGTHGPEQAIAAGVRISGCTVHVVDAGVDTGPIIAQAAVPVLPDDEAATLHERIQHAEHALLPRVIDAIARGAIVLEPDLRVPASTAGSDRTDMLLSLPLPDGPA